MKERPILFSAPMIRAILDGRKSVTRRVINPQPIHAIMGDQAWDAFNAMMSIGVLPVEAVDERRIGWTWKGCRSMPWPSSIEGRGPYGQPGSRLWVRETWAAPHDCDHLKPSLIPEGTPITFRATAEGDTDLLWRPSIFLMPWMARVKLDVTGVKVERVQEITHEDAMAEGVQAWTDSLKGGEFYDHNSNLGAYPVTAFARLWDKINGKRAPWDSNPFVWCVAFRKLEASERAA